MRLLATYKYLFVLFLVLAGTKSYAQQDPQWSYYMFNQLFYNPAFAGVEGFTNLSAFHRSQWAGYSSSFDGSGGAPSTQLISLNAPILRYRSGAGFHMVNDNLGPLNNLEAQVSYAYHLGIGNSKLSLGFRAGMFSQSINFDRYRVINPDDPLIRGGRESQIRPDMAVGAFFRHEKYFAGISFNHLLKSEFDFGLDSLRNPLENHSFITFGYDYELDYNLIITPSFLVKTDFNTFSFDINVLATYREKMWGGLSYRQGEAAVLMLGYSLLKDNSLRAGYAFDYILQAREAKQPTSHEIFISYTLPMATASGKKIQRTPRFRH